MGEQQLTVDFDREEGEPMGVLTDENLMVTRVQDGTLADGKIQLGDVMQKVNGYQIKDKNHFFQLLQRCYPTQLTFIRSSGRAEQMAASQLPQNLEKMIQRRAGYEYPLMEVDCSKFPGKALGLVLATRQHKVYVTGAKNGTVAGEFFKPSDRMLVVNGLPVSDKEVAKAAIVRSAGKFLAVIERAASDWARTEVKQLENSYRQQQAAAAARAAEQAKASLMPADVEMIMAEQRRKTNNSQIPVKRILVHRSSSRDSSSGRRVTYTPGHQEVQIASDVDPNKRLRNVPKG